MALGNLRQDHRAGTRYSPLVEQETQPSASTDAALFDDAGTVEEQGRPLLPLESTPGAAPQPFARFFLAHAPTAPSGRAWPLIKSILVWLLPTFVTASVSHFTARPESQPKPQKLRPTAYLDGLRGVAAGVVYISHTTVRWYPELLVGYGVRPTDTMFLQLPIIRLINEGRASVSVFFVISGFVLSLRALTFIRQNKNDQALSTLAGTTFRRPFRLFLPVVVSTGIVAIVKYGRFYVDLKEGKDWEEPAGNTIFEQFFDWLWATTAFMDRFRQSVQREKSVVLTGHRYDTHTWTILFEMRGSILVMVLLLAFARAKRWVHAAASFFIVCWMALHGDPDHSLFPLGMLFAELSLILAARSSPGASHSLPPQLRRPGLLGPRAQVMLHHIATLLLCVTSMFLMSMPPNYPDKTTGYVFLTRHGVPQWYIDHKKGGVWWRTVGGALFVLSLMLSPAVSFRFRPWAFCCRFRLPWHQTRQVDIEKIEAVDETSVAGASPAEPLLQQPFTSTFAQYLGRISYGMYLCHGCINHTISMRYLKPAKFARDEVMHAAQLLKDAGKIAEATEMRAAGWTDYRHEFFWHFLINTIAVLWVSDIFTKAVDEPIVRLARWLAEKAWRKDTK